MGLFGHTRGATIRNVVLDATCSVACTCTSENAYAGGIVGYCEATNKASCTFKDIASSASVTFTGKTIKTCDKLGGLVGRCRGTPGMGCDLSDSVSYGTVTHTGPGKETVMGGIYGVCTGDDNSNALCRTYNSASYSSLVHSGITKGKLVMGGILGRGNGTAIENCVFAGSLATNKKKAIVGFAAGSLKLSKVIRVFWDPSSSSSSSNANSIPNETPLAACGINDENTAANTVNASHVTFGEAVAESLSEYRHSKLGFLESITTSSKKDWVLLHMNGGSINGAVTRPTVATLRAFVPTPKKNGERFVGWYIDRALRLLATLQLWKSYRQPPTQSTSLQWTRQKRLPQRLGLILLPTTHTKKWTHKHLVRTSSFLRQRQMGARLLAGIKT